LSFSVSGALRANLTSSGVLNVTGSYTANGVAVPTISSTSTLTNKTLTSPVISGGSIDNATIGATTRSSGAFTTLAANGAVTFASTLTVTDVATFSSSIVANSALTVAGATTLSSTLGVSGITTLGSSGFTGTHQSNGDGFTVNSAAARSPQFTLAQNGTTRAALYYDHANSRPVVFSNGQSLHFSTDAATTSSGNIASSTNKWTIGAPAGVQVHDVVGGLSLTTTLGVGGASTLAALSATTGSFSSTLGVTGAITNNGVAVPTISSTSTLTNKSLVDASTFFIDDADSTKKVVFEISSIATGTTKTWTFPDQSDTFVGLTVAQTLTNKTLTSPVISGGTINNASVGATTRSSGAFTTLAADGATSLTSTLAVTDVATFSSSIVANSAIVASGLGTFTVGVKVKNTGSGSTTLSHYEEGSATLTLSGGVSATSAMTYTRVGNVVTVKVPGATGTSSSTSNPQFSAVTASIRPATAQSFFARVTNNSTLYIGYARINTDGTIDIFWNADASDFTASSSKGLSSDCVFTYNMV